MLRICSAIAGFILLLSPPAAAQQGRSATPTEKAPWVLSVVHKVDLQRVLERMKEQQQVRLGVPGSAPQVVYNVATGLLVDYDGHVVTRLAYADARETGQDVSVTTATGVTLPARFIGIDLATGFAVLQVDGLRKAKKTVLPRFAAPQSLIDGLNVKILSADLRPLYVPSEKNAEIRVATSFRLAQGQIEASSAYARARGALTLRSGSLLSRSDSSIVTTLDDQVAGLAQFAGFGRAFVYPIDFIRDVVAQRVIAHRGSVSAGWLGVSGESLSQVSPVEAAGLGYSGRAGVLVREVTPNSPAAGGELVPSDLIVGVDGFDVSNTSDLGAALASLPAGREITLRVVRRQELLDVRVALAPRPYSGPAIALESFELGGGSLAAQRQQLDQRLAELRLQHRRNSERANLDERIREEMRRELEVEIRQVFDMIRALETEMDSQRRLEARSATVEAALTVGSGSAVAFPQGFAVRELTGQLAEYFGSSGGMLVVSIAKGSPAERAGIQAGDVIVGLVEGGPMNAAQLNTALAKIQGLIQLRIVRDRKPSVAVITP